jgi:hypothetical protein
VRIDCEKPPIINYRNVTDQLFWSAGQITTITC